MCENQTNYYRRLKERPLQKEQRDMVIWVCKDVVYAACDQRAVVQRVRGINIDIRLLGDNHEFTIHPRDIVGVEIDDSLTIRFNSPGHQTREIHCYRGEQ